MIQLEATGVSKGFGAVQALNGISLSASPGQCLALVGANGAGKSTLLQIVSGTMRPDEGRVVIDGWELNTQSGWMGFRRSLRLGYMGTQCMLYSDLTIKENLLLIARLARMASPREAVDAICQRLDILEHVDKFVRECSQGTLRRAGAARALLVQPQILLLDEPLANLDLDGRERIKNLLRESREAGAMILVATHEQEVIDELADRVIELARGRIVSEQQLGSAF